METRNKSHLWAVYLASAVPLTFAAALWVPIFQVPDEPAHLYRAEQLMHGAIVGEARLGRAGGQVDAGLDTLRTLLNSAAAAPPDASMMRAARALAWHRTLAFADFPNTAQYGPLLYLPQIIGLGVGKILGLGVLYSALLARVVNALSSIIVATIALALCQRGQSLLMTTFLLPMSVFEMGSASQEAGIIAVAGLCVALASRGRRLGGAGYTVMTVGLLALAMARAPLLGLALLLLLPALGKISLRQKILAFACVCVLAVGWLGAVRHLSAPMRPDVPASIVPQIEYLRAHPNALGPLFVETWQAQHMFWWHSTVGVLGWLNLWLPSWAYTAALLAFALCVCDTVRQRQVVRPVDQLLAATAGAACFGALLLALYLTWTPVASAPPIQGAQGRYFLSFLPLSVLILPSFSRPLTQLRRLPIVTATWLLSTVILFGAGQAVVARYRPDQTWPSEVSIASQETPGARMP